MFWMATLKNIRKTFVSGSVAAIVDAWGDLGCVMATPSTSYDLAYCWPFDSWKAKEVANCSGIVLNSKGYDTFELNIDWGLSWSDWASDGWNIHVYVYGSDSPMDFNSPPVYTGDYQAATFPVDVPVTTDYIKIAAQIVEGRWYYTGYATLYQPSLMKQVTVAVKTPKKYPVYDAIVNVIDADDNGALGSFATDSNGDAAFSVDIIDHANIKLWAEKAINKSVLSLTAKDISQLLEVNVDQ